MKSCETIQEQIVDQLTDNGHVTHWIQEHCAQCENCLNTYNDFLQLQNILTIQVDEHQLHMSGQKIYSSVVHKYSLWNSVRFWLGDLFHNYKFQYTGIFVIAMVLSGVTLLQVPQELEDPYDQDLYTYSTFKWLPSWDPLVAIEEDEWLTYAAVITNTNELDEQDYLKGLQGEDYIYYSLEEETKE